MPMQGKLDWLAVGVNNLALQSATMHFVSV